MAFLKTNISKASSHEWPLSVNRKRLLSCTSKYLGSTTPSSANQLASFCLTVDQLISMSEEARDVIEGLSDGRWSGLHTVHLISGHGPVCCVSIIFKKPGNEDVGLMRTTMPRTKAFVLSVQLFWTGEQWPKGRNTLPLHPWREAPDWGPSLPHGWWTVAQGRAVSECLPPPAPRRLQ